MAERTIKSEPAFSEVKVKKEVDGDYMGRHSHTFKVKFSPTDNDKYNITCDYPRTVLEAIKSTEKYKEEITKNKWSDENIVIQLGKADREFAVATHFPCSCISNNQLLIISCKKEKVQEVQDQDYTIYAKENYSVFYIDTTGGKNTKQKKLFRNNIFKEFKFVCVYGEKGMTVEEALKRDGRFLDDLNVFTLTDNENPESKTEHTQKVDQLDRKKFKLCLPLQKRKRKQSQQGIQRPSKKSQPNADKVPRLDVCKDVAQQSEVSVIKTAVEKRSSNNTEEVYRLLCQQFPNLKKWMESRFPNNSYQDTVNLRKENFGKIQNSFSKIHTVRNLIKLGESVCRIEILCCSSLTVYGTGFVLFDNYILTNSHLFKPCAELQGDNWQEHTKITAMFNYENTDSNQNSFNVSIFGRSDNDNELDYAILKLMVQNHSQTAETEERKLPPGLLKILGPPPESGGACIIGHPKGEVKKMDLTCVIEKENREQAVNSNLEDYKDYIFTLCSINHSIKNDPHANNIVTYNTFMFHGSSGSPVFNAYGQVFGLHTAGFFFDDPKPGESVIEFAHPLLTIFKHFVSVLKENRNEELLIKVQEEAKGNSHLETILKPVVGSSEVKAEEENYLKQPKDQSDVVEKIL